MLKDTLSQPWSWPCALYAVVCASLVWLHQLLLWRGTCLPCQVCAKFPKSECESFHCTVPSWKHLTNSMLSKVQSSSWLFTRDRWYCSSYPKLLSLELGILCCNTAAWMSWKSDALKEHSIFTCFAVVPRSRRHLRHPLKFHKHHSYWLRWYSLPKQACCIS